MMHQLAALFCAVTISTNASLPAAPQRYSDFSGILQEVNASHAQIDAPRADLEKYRYDFDGGKPLFSREDGALLRAYDWDNPPDTKTLSVADAQAEISWIMRLMRTQYGLYTWSGGDEAFENAESALLHALPESGTISLEAYQALLLDKLSFIKDNHLSIGNKSFSPGLILFGNESQPYYRIDGKFYLDAGGTKEILSINGASPTVYLKRAIGKDGALTWYPYQMAAKADSIPLTISTTAGLQQRTLYPSKSFESLPAQDDAKYSYQLKSGIPCISLREMVFGDGDSSGWAGKNDEADKQNFLASVQDIKAYPYAVIDISLNPGGNGDLPYEWFQAYTGQAAQPNYCTLRIRARPDWFYSAYGAREPDEFTSLTEYYDAYHAQTGLKSDGDYYVQYPTAQYLENDGPTLFILTSRRTASAAEGFSDLLHNLENVVFIGANTGGVLTNGANYGIALPYSGLFFQFGECLFCWDRAYFEEGVGLEPDIYLTGDNLDMRLNQFLKLYTTVAE